jgi:hypothetical protein
MPDASITIDKAMILNDLDMPPLTDEKDNSEADDDDLEEDDNDELGQIIDRVMELEETEAECDLTKPSYIACALSPKICVLTIV